MGGGGVKFHSINTGGGRKGGIFGTASTHSTRTGAGRMPPPPPFARRGRPAPKAQGRRFSTGPPDPPGFPGRVTAVNAGRTPTPCPRRPVAQTYDAQPSERCVVGLDRRAPWRTTWRSGVGAQRSARCRAQGAATPRPFMLWLRCWGPSERCLQMKEVAPLNGGLVPPPLGCSWMP